MTTAGVSTTERTIPLSVPVLQGNEWTYLKECLDTGWVSTVGPFVDRFEQEIAAYLGVSHAVATSSGTAALHIALKVAGVQEGDEVLVSDLTFIAPVNAIRYCGAHPVFIDADPNTWQMDVEKAARFLRDRCEPRRPRGDATEEYRNTKTGRRVRAILPVHILGLACDMQFIMERLAKQYHLRVVADAAEAMGVLYWHRHIAAWGHVVALSFNGNKIITAGGGGMVVMSNQPVTARYARFLTTQAKDDGPEYIHREVGYNYRLTNLQAAVGLAQLEQLEGFIQRKRSIAAFYEKALRDVSELTLMPTPAHTEPTFWLYTVLLKPGTSVPARQAFIERLRAQGIEARPLWHPIHRLPPYQD